MVIGRRPRRVVTTRPGRRSNTIHDSRFTIHRICLIIATLSGGFEILFGVGRRVASPRPLLTRSHFPAGGDARAASIIEAVRARHPLRPGGTTPTEALTGRTRNV